MDLGLTIFTDEASPYLYDNRTNSSLGPKDTKHLEIRMSVMKTPVMLTPGFSSLVFEFWRFDFSYISFGIFLIWIKDAGSLRS